MRPRSTDPFLQAALGEARQGLAEGGSPIGSVLVHDGDVIVLTPTHELLTADVIQDVRAAIESSSARDCVIDFKHVRFLVSGSLDPRAEPITPLINLHQQLLAESRRLVLGNLSRDIAELFRITRIDQILDVQADLGTGPDRCSE